MATNTYKTELSTRLSMALDALRQFITNPNFEHDIHLAFGDQVDSAKATHFIQGFTENVLPTIEIRPGDHINNANGAYVASIDTIYLSSEFLLENTNNPEAIQSVLLEELGHALDARLNTTDTQGDEGELFSAWVRNETLTKAQIQLIQAENDSKMVVLDGQNVTLEQSSHSLGELKGINSYVDSFWETVTWNSFLNTYILSGSVDLEDDYTFTTVETGTANNAISVQADNPLTTSVNLNIQLKDASGQLVGYSYNSGSALESVSLANLPAGTYTLHIYDVLKGSLLTPAGGGPVNYSIGFTTPSEPTGTNKTVSLNEDSAYIFSATDFGYVDGDGNTMVSLKITSLPGAGSLKLNNSSVAVGQVIATSSIGNLIFTPVHNANASAYANFNFTVNDGVLDSVSANTITLNVAAVNDAPTASNSIVTFNQNSSYAFSTGNFSYADIDGDALTSIKITSLPAAGSLTLDNTAVTVGQVIPADLLANLTFTPVTHANGTSYARLYFTVNDGSTDSVAANTITFNVTAVNDAPTATDKTVTLNEDISYNFSSTDFGYADSNGDALSSVKITSLPSAGLLKINDAAVTVGQVIPAVSISNLTFSPFTDANGSAYANFNFTVNDGKLDSVSGNTITLSVSPVNDLPTGAVTINGVFKQGEILTVASSLVDNDGLGIISYQWRSNNTLIGNDNSYTLTQAEVGKTVTVTANYVDGQGTAESVSSTASPIITVNSRDIVFSANDVTTNENGDTVTIGMKLTIAPTAGRTVIVNLSSTDTTEGVITSGQTFTFTSDNWNIPQNIIVKGVNDYEADGPIAYNMTAIVDATSSDVNYRQITVNPLTLTNEEDVTTEVLTVDTPRIPIGTPLDTPLKLVGDSTVDISQIDPKTGLFKVTGALFANDVLQGLDGNDTLFGGYYQDDLSGGLGDDQLNGGDDEDFLYGETGNDTLLGGGGADSLVGGSGDDELDGGAGDLAADTLVGGAGNDTYYLGYGAVDVITDKGLVSDIDTIIMPYQLTRYTLPSGIENGTIAPGTATSNLTGNASNNTLTGNEGKNTLEGAVGRDSLFGGAGNDALLGGDDNDTLTGGSGADHLEGGSGNDSIDGSAGNDEIIGGSGAGDDIYIGGLGIDTIKYTSTTTGITIDLVLGTAHGNQINNDTLSGIENIVGGQAGDILNGNANNNALDGFKGNDTISGGAGKDTLTGGLGADRFTFNSETETGITVTTRDIIADFKRAQGDKINLSAIDANQTTIGNDAFSILTVGGTFVGTFTGPGRLYFDQGAHILYGNNDADGAADFSIQLTGVGSLVVADVVL